MTASTTASPVAPSAAHAHTHPTGTARDLLLSVIAPASWGTTYVVTSELLPDHRPMLAATMRALPAGLILLAFVRRLPKGSWWWKTAVLGTLNFGAFFPLLFFAAYRLPGGLASTLGSVQPLLVAGFSILILRQRPHSAVLGAAAVGTVGVALMTLTGKARLDPLGVLAMLVATALMALAVVLGRKWGRPEGATPMVLATWQLVFGGLLLLPMTLASEGLPDTLSAKNVAGFAYIGIVGTAVAYTLWFRGIERLAPTSLSLLSLANPMVATVAGFVVLHQSLTAPQAAGFAVALGALVSGQVLASRRR
ncbi:EamA family transporter [Catenulispora sp. NL8]|uniref:EamA family transporter n=1 Tax=Catenulispora pinistramenti TaxID=2705254 RepID=A0ABS5KU70_9ACTN|nr:EamA family transporter [Catenulispora pinistramenti]MBS2549601.1 EamA family transporter [Catenulispora pinistramenti]